VDDWFFDLPVLAMAAIIVGLTIATTAIVWVLVTRLVASERGRFGRGVSPGLLPVLGIVFAFLAGFIAVGVWGELDHARTAVNAEAGAVRDAALLSSPFDADTQSRLRDLLRQHVQHAATVEWPAMATKSQSLAPPAPLVDALHLTLGLVPASDGQRVAQQKVAEALLAALEARRERILISQGGVNAVKWAGLIVIAIIALVGIAFVHAETPGAAAVAMTLFAIGVALSLIMIASHNRPFSGELSIRPDFLLQAIPAAAS
jgi:hypothetical protein